jgi:PKD repeat protein
MDSVVLTVGNSFKPGTLTASKDSVCEGTPIKLTVTGSEGTVLWQSSGSQSGFKNISGATDTAYSLSASNTGYYRTIANNGVCGDTSIAYLLTVIPSPVTTFTSFTIGQQVTFTPTTSGGVVNYSWNFGDNTTSTDSFPIHTYSENASYNVCLTVYNKSDCSYTTCNNVDIGVSGVQNVTQKADWNIFPNPATGNITLVTNSSGGEKTSIEITNVLGEVVYAKIVSGNKSLIDLSQLSTGAYFVHLRSGNASDVKKLIKD